MWDDKELRRWIAEKIIEVWEEHSPGFKENVLDYWVTTPLDNERSNLNYIRGCWGGGSVTAHQMWYGNRPGADGFDKGGIVTPIKNLFCSGSVGVSLTHGGNGYKTAGHIAEEMGIRNQPWWVHRVFEYFAKKYIAKTYVPLKPVSILDRK